MNSRLLQVITGIALLLIIIQFIPVDRSTPSTEANKDFLNIHKPNHEMAMIIINGCYDCHSYKTNYLWYSKVAPVSWWRQNHVNEGREHMNFSLWGNYTSNRADHKLEEAIDLIEAEEMPLPAYVWAHSGAHLKEEQRKELMNYLASLRTYHED
jgi:hypothetical protein